MVQAVHKTFQFYIMVYACSSLSLFLNVAPAPDTPTDSPTDSPSGTGDGTDVTLPSGAPPTVAAGVLFVATASFIAALL